MEVLHTGDSDVEEEDEIKDIKLAIVNIHNDYFLMRPDEITSLVNRHFQSITSVHFLTDRTMQEHFCYYTLIIKKRDGVVITVPEAPKSLL
jgi:hypothetical protein